MKHAINLLIIIMFTVFTADSFAQPGDLSLPKRPSTQAFKTTYYSDNSNSVILLDGVNISASVLQKIDVNDIASVKGLEDSTMLSPVLPRRRVTITEIASKNNETLKYILEKSGHWTLDFPYSVYMIDNEIIAYDSQLERLQRLSIDDIREIKTFDPEKGSQMFGEQGKNGLISIITN